MARNDQTTVEVFKGMVAELWNLRLWANRESITANKTLTHSDKSFQVLAPDAARDVLLPTEKDGLVIIVANNAAGAFALTVKEDSGTTTIATVAQDGVGIFISDGTGWSGFTVAGVVT